MAAVNKNGSVTAQNAGTAKITVTVREEKAGKSSGTVKKKTWVKIKVTNPSSDKKEDTAEPPAASSIPEVSPTSTVTDSPAPTPVETPDISENRKSIVVYFSCTNNTKTIAEYVAEGAELCRKEWCAGRKREYSCEEQVKGLEQRKSDKAEEVQAEEIKLDIVKLELQEAVSEFENVQKQADFMKEQVAQQYGKYWKIEPSERGTTMFDDMLRLKWENMILEDKNRTL